MQRRASLGFSFVALSVSAPIPGAPAVDAGGQGGLLDIAVGPSFSKDGSPTARQERSSSATNPGGSSSGSSRVDAQAPGASLASRVDQSTTCPGHRTVTPSAQRRSRTGARGFRSASARASIDGASSPRCCARCRRPERERRVTSDVRALRRGLLCLAWHQRSAARAASAGAGTALLLRSLRGKTRPSGSGAQLAAPQTESIEVERSITIGRPRWIPCFTEWRRGPLKRRRWRGFRFRAPHAQPLDAR